MKATRLALLQPPTLGVRLPSGMTLDTRRGRRTFEIAHKVHTEDYRPDLDMRQRRCKNQPSAARYHIDHLCTPHTQSRALRFHGLALTQPSDWIEEEVLRHGKSANALGSTALSTAVEDETNPSALAAVDIALLRVGYPLDLALGVIREAAERFSGSSSRVSLSASSKLTDLGQSTQQVRIHGIPTTNVDEVCEELLAIDVQDEDDEEIRFVVQSAGRAPSTKRLSVADATRTRYEVALRSIPKDSTKAAKHSGNLLQRNGMPNYFGSSCFSDFTQRDAHPGLHLLKGEFRAAATAIVHTDSTREQPLEYLHQRLVTPTVREQLADALALSEDGASDGNVACMQTFLSGVGKHVCMSFVYEFLCFVWNAMASRRIHMFGCGDPVVGDLVRVNDPSSGSTGQIAWVTKRDVELRKYSKFDIVLPLPGNRVVFPQHAIEDAFRQTLGGYGLHYDAEIDGWSEFSAQTEEQVAEASSSHVTTRGNSIGANVGGEYRPLFVQPSAWKQRIARDGKSFKMTVGFELPRNAFPSVLVRELTKYDEPFAPLLAEVEEQETESAENIQKKAELVWKRLQSRKATASYNLRLATIQKTMFKHAGPTTRSVVPNTNVQRSVV